MKRIQHILTIVLLTALCVSILGSCRKNDSESEGGNTNLPPQRIEETEHPAVVAFKGFAETIANKDVEKMFDYAPADAQAQKEQLIDMMKKNPAIFDTLPKFGTIQSVEEKGEDEVLIVCETQIGSDNGLFDITMKKVEEKWIVGGQAVPHREDPETK